MNTKGQNAKEKKRIAEATCIDVEIKKRKRTKQAVYPRRNTLYFAL
jgi:hypothetical protein